MGVEPTAPWSVETRRWVLIGLVILAALVLYWIRETLTVLVLALILAYLLNPLVALFQRHARISRLLAAGLIYLAFITLLIALAGTLTPIVVRQFLGLAADLDQILARLDAALQQFPLLGTLGLHVNVTTLANQLRAEMTTIVAFVPRVLIGVGSGVFRTVLVLVLSFYLLKDAEMIGRGIENAVPGEYRNEFRRIRFEFASIWSSFLRGQIVLALIIGTVTTLVLTVLGVRNALLLGLLAGILEVVPNLGPIIAAIPAVLIAFFQGSANWGIENTTFALIVVVAYVLIQQLENHLIVPSVLGSSVNLPPVVILFGALAGASLAGILGIFLAAPLLATARLIGRFLFQKLLEPEAATKSGE
ncbi:MAG: AI-2E family transporter [Chloroflexi bacterium]|nr:AI-2E family transporter [Chloroflexota bacterium]